MTANTLKVRYEEILIGMLLGLGVGYAITAPLLLLSGQSIPSAIDLIWPLALLRDVPDRLVRAPDVIVSLAGFAGAAFGGWFAARQTSEQHVRGARFIAEYHAAAKALQAIETPRMSSAQRARKVPGIVLGGLEWSRNRETEHFLVLGLPGGGKTAGVLRPLLDQALERRDRVLLHDPKGDFCGTHFDAKRTVLLGPWDARGALWDASGDIDSPALADEFAAAICGVADAGQNLFFHQGAATILGGLIKSYMRDGRRWTWSMLGSALQSDALALITQAAKGDVLVRQLIPSAFAARQPGEEISLSVGERSVLSTFGNSIRTITNLAAVDRARPNGERFSLRRWLLGSAHQDIRLVILNSSALYQRACEAIFGSMLTVVSATVSAAMPEKSADADDSLWCIIDEGKQAGAIALERLQVIAEVGRSRGVRVVLGLQDAGQLEAAVGREKAEPMMSMQSSRIYLRAAPACAETVVKMVGEREIQRIQTTASGGAVTGKTSVYERVPVLTTADLTGLRSKQLSDATVDIEMLVAIEDTLGKLVQNTGPRSPRIAQQFVPCPAWCEGVPSELSFITIPPRDGKTESHPGGSTTMLASPSEKPFDCARGETADTSFDWT